MQENTENRIRIEVYVAVLLFIVVIIVGVVFYRFVEGLN